MNRLFRILFWLGMSLWLGGMVFFSFITAPIAFNVLPLPEAIRLVPHYFPPYYTLGQISGGLAFLAALLLWLQQRRHSLLVAALGCLAGLLPLVYAAQVLLAQVDQLPPGSAAFDAAHHLAVVLNTASMGGALLGLLAMAWGEQKAAR